ncbi:desmoglein-2 [Latimeria chalumnae]|uniref:desmoglein-2 n=1 Tax=Latimeria chalumnae TaxID=7897 RepID=UPI00313CCFB4
MKEIRSDKVEEDPNVYYRISGKGANEPPYGLFVVDEKTGYINITRTVDREEFPFFILQGRAYNSLNTEIETPLELRVKIADVNDNDPVFTAEVFVGSVEELSERNTLVMNLNATDADEEGTPNSQIAYRILSQKPEDMLMFRIDKNTGKIYITGVNLDRELDLQVLRCRFDITGNQYIKSAKNLEDYSKACHNGHLCKKDTSVKQTPNERPFRTTEYELEVEARDLNGILNGKTDTSKVNIKVLDVNDHFPRLEKENYEGSVKEHTADVEVLRMKALDDDEEFSDNWLAAFEIESGNEGGYFAIETDAQTNEGVLKLKEVDYEELQNLQLNVAVKNKAAFHSSLASSGKRQSIPVKINIENMKEGPAFKPKQKPLFVKEESKTSDLMKIIGTYPAYDSDTGKIAGNMRYAKEFDPGNWLYIDPHTAEIKLKATLDRESPQLVDGVYTAKILAITEDHPAKTATGTILLNIEDVNDHCPTIVNMAPHMCKNAGRINVTAVDEDADPNAGPFTFHIVDEPKGNADKWEINKTHDTSVLITSKKPVWANLYEIQVDVKDRQGLSCPEKQTLKVEVCQCPDGINCAALRTSDEKTAELGGGAIGLMILGLLMLLLVPLLLLFCKSENTDYKPALCGDSGIETLDKVNSDAGTVDTKKPLSSVPNYMFVPNPVDTGRPSFVPNPVGTGRPRPETATGIKGKGYHNGLTKSNILFDEFSMKQGQYDEGKHWTIPTTGGPGPLDRIEGILGGGGVLNEAFLDMYLTEWAQNYTEEMSQPASDFLIYNDEEMNSQCSVGCCSFIEDDQDDFLNDLGPKFKTLAEICIGKEISMDVQPSQFGSTLQSSSMAIDAVITKNTVGTSPALQVTKTVQEPKIQQNVVVTERSHSSDSDVQAVKLPVDSIVHKNVVVTEKSYSTGSGIKTTRLPADSMVQTDYVVTEKSYTAAPSLQATRPSAVAVSQSNYGVIKMSDTSGPTLQATRVISDPLIVVSERKVVSGSGMEGTSLRSDPLLTQSFFTTEQLLTPSLPLNLTTSRAIKYSTVQYSE